MRHLFVSISGISFFSVFRFIFGIAFMSMVSCIRSTASLSIVTHVLPGSHITTKHSKSRMKWNGSHYKASKLVVFYKPTERPELTNRSCIILCHTERRDLHTIAGNSAFEEVALRAVILSINRDESVVSGADGSVYFESASKVRMFPCSDLCADSASNNFKDVS